jgi:CII-binding regulator of phage lambda lysogenization HflD
MSGKTIGLTPLETRKQLLLMESEMNRLQWEHELRELKAALHQIQHQAQAVGSLASSAARLATVISDIHGAFSQRAENNGNKSFLSKMFNGLRMGTSLFGAFRRRSK